MPRAVAAQTRGGAVPAPTLFYDAREGDRATAVEALTARVAGDRIALRPRVDPLPDVVYRRVVRGTDGRTWTQFWLLYADNPQDRGILRTGRHEGDWELVQVGTGRGPAVATFSQHKWAEACPWRGRIYVANGSHASYPTPGEHGRPWPDPDDEARGDGRVVMPLVRQLGPWVRWPGRWGRAKARWWNPAEASSPRGPAFQDRDPPTAWADPAGFHASARACGSGAPPLPLGLRMGAATLLAALLAAVALKVHRRKPM